MEFGIGVDGLARAHACTTTALMYYRNMQPGTTLSNKIRKVQEGEMSSKYNGLKRASVHNHSNVGTAPSRQSLGDGDH